MKIKTLQIGKLTLQYRSPFGFRIDKLVIDYTLGVAIVEYNPGDGFVKSIRTVLDREELILTTCTVALSALVVVLWRLA